MFGMAHGKSIILYLFDRCSGIFSHYYTIDSIFTGNPSDCINGIEFSLDGTKLYATKSGGVGNGISKLYQYDLAATDIKSSQVILRQDSLGYMYSSLQLAPNGKIYCAMPHDGVEYYSYDAPQNLSLSVINNPNEAGIACDYEHLAQYLGGKRVTYALPNMPNYNLGVLPKSACDTLGTAINNIQASGAFHIYPNPAQENIYIASDTYKIEKCLLELYNSTGTLVSSNDNVFVNATIQLPKLNEGVYLAIITTSSGKQFSEKLVITE